MREELRAHADGKFIDAHLEYAGGNVVAELMNEDECAEDQYCV